MSRISIAVSIDVRSVESNNAVKLLVLYPNNGAARSADVVLL